MFILNKKFSFWLVVILSVSISYFFIWYFINQPVGGQDIERLFVINKGDTARQVARNLKGSGLIKNDLFFLFYLWQSGSMGKLQAGEYVLSSRMNIPEIIYSFINGLAKPNYIQVTIPEGFNLRKIDARLTEAGLIKAGELISYNNLIKSQQLELQVTSYKLRDLEGFLFPDTYRFTKDDGVENIVQKMLDNFEQKIDGNLRAEIKKSGHNLYEIITMASILEKEVKTNEDRKIVAGIFWDRIKRGQPLESCATIAYILGVDKWRYSYADTRTPSPYNTYLNKGLPPTPINNPGLATILAAVDPVDTQYNYFLTDPATEKTIFSKTFEEHSRNKAKYF